MNRIISYTVVVIVAIALSLFKVYIAKSAEPVYHKCVESGFDFYSEKCSYNVNYVFETQTGVSCPDTATMDSLVLALEGTVDALGRVGKNTGSALFKHTDGWKTYMTIERRSCSSSYAPHTPKTEVSKGKIYWGL